MSPHRRRMRVLASASATLVAAGTFLALTPASPASTSVADASSWSWTPWSHHPEHAQTPRRHRAARAVTSGAASAATTGQAVADVPVGSPAAVPPSTSPAAVSTTASQPSPLVHADRATRPSPAVPSVGQPTPSSKAPLAPVPVAGQATAVTSGSAVPNADLPGWHLVLSQDFTRDAALGQFASAYPGWASYDGDHDTSGNGTYNSATTTTVHGGVLDEYLHTQGGRAQVMALTPPGGAAHQTYGRYAVRFRSDVIPDYKIAWLLWPCNDNWSEGEIDFPEADLDHTIEGYAHDVTGSPSRNAWSVQTGTSLTDWHTAVVEWSPSGLTYTLDGRSWHTSDASAVPQNPMNWVLQTETAENGPNPSASVSGHIDIDWVAAWSAT